MWGGAQALPTSQQRLHSPGTHPPGRLPHQVGQPWFLVPPERMAMLKSKFAEVEDWDLLGVLQPHFVLFAAVAANQPITVGGICAV
jgi:hypothetical protein